MSRHSSRPEFNAPIRVFIHGLSYFSKLLPPVLDGPGWDIRNYDYGRSTKLFEILGHLAQSDLVYTWSGRITMGKFLTAARALRKKKLVTFWCGSDVLEAQKDRARVEIEPWIADKIHWAGAPWLAEEIRSIGLPCEYVPSTWVPDVPALPEFPKTFRVLAYLCDADRIELYGIDQVIQVARALPAVQFSIVGLRAGQRLDVPSNVSLHGWASNLHTFYRDSTVLWRPTRHDGLSFMALEALAYGRYVLWTYPFTGAIRTQDPMEAKSHIEAMYELQRSGRLPLNRAGADYVAANFSRAQIRRSLLERWRGIVHSANGSAVPVSGFATEMKSQSTSRSSTASN